MNRLNKIEALLERCNRLESNQIQTEARMKAMMIKSHLIFLQLEEINKSIIYVDFVNRKKELLCFVDGDTMTGSFPFVKAA